MLPLSGALIVAGFACILFDTWLASNVGGSADRRAAYHRVVGNPPPRFLYNNKRHNHRPQTTRGVRLSGVLFIFVGLFFLLIGTVFGSV